MVSDEGVSEGARPGGDEDIRLAMEHARRDELDGAKEHRVAMRERHDADAVVKALSDSQSVALGLRRKKRGQISQTMAPVGKGRVCCPTIDDIEKEIREKNGDFKDGYSAPCLPFFCGRTTLQKLK